MITNFLRRYLWNKYTWRNVLSTDLLLTPTWRIRLRAHEKKSTPSEKNLDSYILYVCFMEIKKGGQVNGCLISPVYG